MEPSIWGADVPVGHSAPVQSPIAGEDARVPRWGSPLDFTTPGELNR